MSSLPKKSKFKRAALSCASEVVFLGTGWTIFHGRAEFVRTRAFWEMVVSVPLHICS